jgi:hypothetical protein
MYESSNTRSFYNMAWIAFAISFVGMAVGIFYIPADFGIKAFLAMTYFFSVTSCFTVAKVVRDKHESDRIINRVENAKTENFLNKYGDPVSAT